MEFLQYMCSNNIWSEVFMEYNTVQDQAVGSAFGTTMIGGLFSLSILPKINNNKYEYFDRPMEDVSIAQALKMKKKTKMYEISIVAGFIFLTKVKTAYVIVTAAET